MTIPVSVTGINNSAFFNCSALADVNYSGTRAQWNAVTIDDTDDGNAALHSATIHCTDGDIINGAAADDSDILAQGECGVNGDNLTWVLTNNGTLTISGTGAMIDSAILQWQDYEEDIVNVAVNEGASSIGTFAFDTVSSLESISIPNSVAQIGRNAFMYCDKLSNVVIPGPISVIEIQLFYECARLSSVSIPASVSRIEDSAFYGTSIQDVYYSGTRAQWNAVTIDDTDDGNAALHSATIHCTDGDIVNGAADDSDQQVTVTLNPGSGSNDAERIEFVNKDSEYTLPSADTFTPKMNYTFRNWLVGNETKNPGDMIAVNGDIEITAMWDFNVVFNRSVVFNGNGGTPESVSVSVSVLTNDTVSPPATNPARDGYEFTGWYTDPQATTAFDFATPITENTTLYAGWRLVLPPDVLSQGACGANLTYVLRTDGTLTISGTGAMSDYSASAPAPWYANRQSIRAAVLESGVVSVGAYAFDDCSALSALTLPNSVAAVAPHAFDRCGVLESVSYDGTQEQWDAVIFSTADNDALEFATVRCGDETYNAYRTLGFFGTDGRMDAASEQTWRFPVPLDRFRNLYIDAPDVENAPAENILVRKASPDELSHTEGSREYAATSGSTVLTIPAETFETFEEGSHNITATFRDSREATRTTSNVYTIFPTGPIDINEAELTARAVEDVSYTGRLQTSPKLSDKFYRFTITAATRDGEELPITLRNGGAETVNETANDVQKLGEQEFYFHPNGRFSGIPALPGTYELTVELQVRREISDDWYTPEGVQANPRVVTIVVEGKTADNIRTTSEGYEVIQEPPAEIEQGTPFQIVVTRDPADRLTAVYLDRELLVENRDYTVFEQELRTPRLLEGGILTQLAVNVTKTDISLGLHSVNLEFEHKDPLGNTQTKTVARPITTTPRRTVTPVNTGSSSGSSRSSGSSDRAKEVAPKTYAVNVSKPSNGKITLSVSKVAAGKSVTITVTPNSGYQTASVSVRDTAKKTVKTTRSGNQYTFTMPSRAVTVSASFTPNVYSVAVAASQHGKVTLSRDSASKGTTINGSTTPDKGYLLLSVSVRDASGRAVRSETFNNGKFTFLMPEGRVTVSATFTVKRLATFADIQGPDWFFDDAEWAYNRGILRGVTEQYWEPQSLMSSITSIVTLERLDGVDLTPYDNGADDGLDNSAWYVAALRWANVNGITLSDRPFGGQEALKRGEFAVMLSNYLRYRGITVEAPDGATFSDAAAMTEDELRAFRVLQAADVFRGYSDGSIRPEAYLNRAQLAALLHRLSGYIIGAETA